ncbi:MAG: Si-specific NAD(P)(+) transhydrogenase, partial [Chloroflexota bacterium]
LVIGSGPAGLKGAVQASKLGRRAAVIERMDSVGGVSMHTGTIPSKTLREAVMYLTGYQQRTFYGQDYAVKSGITMTDLLMRAEHVIRNEIEVTRHALAHNDIEVITGTASFVDAHTMSISSAYGTSEITADKILIATGSESARDADVPFDGRRVLTSDDLLRLPDLPQSLAIIGAGVIGVEYCSMFAALGIPTTLIDRRARLLPFLDHEISDALTDHLRNNGAELVFEDDVRRIEPGPLDLIDVHLVSGRTVHADAVLYAIGRLGATADLNLAAAGLEADSRGRILVNADYQTVVPHIYAAGDVIGNPALAATSMEQGRLAACHAFDAPEETADLPLPYAIYTVPEIAMLGPTEEELRAANVPYLLGCASYGDVARGQILGDTTGFLKLIFDPRTGGLMAIHALGTQASELIHVGQAVLGLGGGLDFLLDNVFNYPTLAECYKLAALDAANDMRRMGLTPIQTANAPTYLPKAQP